MSAGSRVGGWEGWADGEDLGSRGTMINAFIRERLFRYRFIDCQRDTIEIQSYAQVTRWECRIGGGVEEKRRT